MAWVLPGWGGRLKEDFSLERDLLAETSALAEELVIEAFGLNSRELKNIQYELITEANFWPLPDFALAGLMRAETMAPLPGKRRQFYFLFLAEKRVSTLAQGDFLKALLLYIFTHELVHMARFARFMASFWMSPQERWVEEQEVHRLTKRLLEPVPSKGLTEIVARFDQIYQ